MQQLTGWVLFLLSIVGHAEWWVIAVNRSHSLPIKATKLRKFRALHDVALPAYPFLLLWLTGFADDSLLRGGKLSEQPWGLKLLLSVTLAGCVPLFLGIGRWQLVRRSQFHMASSRKMHDVARLAETDQSLKDVKGPRWHLLRLWPWNEIFHLEVNTKSVLSARTLSKEKSGDRPVRIVHLSDLHFVGCPGEDYYRFLVARAAEFNADAYVFTGDLIDNVKLLPLAIDVLRPLTKLAPCYFILGNHDWRFDFEQIRQELSDSGWRCVTGIADITTLAGRRVLLAGNERPWMGDVPPTVVEAACDLKILLSHSPDQFRFAQECGYDLMLSGHTHGGQVVLPLIGPVYSPSIYGVSFVSGLFRLGSLTMHVSRGGGAKDPLRWRCPPELTCLEVHC